MFLPTSFWLSELCSWVSFLATQVSVSDREPITAVQSPGHSKISQSQPCSHLDTIISTNHSRAVTWTQYYPPITAVQSPGHKNINKSQPFSHLDTIISTNHSSTVTWTQKYQAINQAQPCNHLNAIIQCCGAEIIFFFGSGSTLSIISFGSGSSSC